jgi:putative phage-type endonuclease
MTTTTTQHPAARSLIGEAVVVAETEGLSRRDWLELRRKGLGGSDIAAAAGLNPHKSPYALWVEKVDGVTDDRETEAMEWGRRLEAPVADAFADRTGLEVIKYPALLAHPEHPWMLANVDRFYDDGQLFGVLEVKTAGLRRAQEWEEGEVPDYAAVQGHQYLAVTGHPRCALAVLIGGQEMRVVWLERDEQLVESLWTIGANFQRLVEERRPPGLDESVATQRALLRRWVAEPGKETDLPDEAQHWLEVRKAAKEQTAAAQAVIDRADNELKAMMADAEVGLLGGRVAVTWKAYTRRGYAVGASSGRTLRVK